MNRQGLGIKMVHGALVLQAFASILLVVSEIVVGPETYTLLNGVVGGVDLRLAFKVDALSTVLLAMVSILAAVISQYSLRYLDGEKNQTVFYKNLYITVTSVSLLVLSSNLIMFFGAWCLTSLGLHRLLLFYSERRDAVVAARKKFLISRIGDVFLLAGFITAYRIFGTFEFDRMFELATDQMFAAGHSLSLSLAGICLVVGAMAKSAQFPLHFWLPETMETPTPVSALMHAGIINAGGFLIIRLSPILTHVELPHLLLTMAGAITAVYGSLVMITQNDIKKKLAYSTISQMGLMIFACGLGAYSIALFHIIAHSFYKAYAFLSTGELIVESKKYALKFEPFGGLYSLMSILAALIVLVVGLNYSNGTHLPYFTYAGILLMALMQCVVKLPSRDFSRIRYFASIAALMLTAVGIYSAIEIYVSTRMMGLVADTFDPVTLNSPVFWVYALSLGIFGLGFYLAGRLYRVDDEFSKKLYMKLWNGNYFGPRSSRVIAAIWPA